MKETFYQRYKHICQIAAQQAEAFAAVVSDSFDDLDSLGEFVDLLFYLHSITYDEQFAFFLEIMLRTVTAKCLREWSVIS